MRIGKLLVAKNGMEGLLASEVVQIKYASKLKWVIVIEARVHLRAIYQHQLNNFTDVC